MRLAWRNLLHERSRLAVTLVGIAFAVFLMTFQGSLLLGFLEASSAVIDAADADLWIMTQGVPCFDFPATLPERFRSMVQGVAGVDEVHRIATGFATWLKPAGSQQTVIVIGADPGVGPEFPSPPTIPGIDSPVPDGVLVDQSDKSYLGLTTLPCDVEINRLRTRVWGTLSGFGSFIGSPYVFARYEDTKRYVRLAPEQTTFLLCQTDAQADLAGVQSEIRRRLPEVDVWTQREFSQRSQNYWVTQTGAGGAILLAGILGFVVGVVIVSQTIYATTMEHIEEFATLKAMGASHWYIRRVVLSQALASGAVGYVIGYGSSIPLLAGLRSSIPWVHTPWWMPFAMILITLLMCALASLLSIRRAERVDPGRVFRA